MPLGSELLSSGQYLKGVLRAHLIIKRKNSFTMKNSVTPLLYHVTSMVVRHTESTLSHALRGKQGTQGTTDLCSILAKNTQSKGCHSMTTNQTQPVKGWGAAQWYLPSTQETLGSMPSTPDNDDCIIPPSPRSVYKNYAKEHSSIKLYINHQFQMELPQYFQDCFLFNLRSFLIKSR